MKVQKISSNVSPFAGISFVNQSFNKSGLSQLIDNELGQRVKSFGFSYSEIIRNLTNVFCSGGSCAEDIQTHLGKIIYNNEDKGNYIISSKGEKFWILEPSTVDLSLKIKRKTTIIYPKEAGLMILETGIGAGSVVAEIGTGSGSLTFMLAKIVGKNGKVFTFEKRKDFLQLAMENLKKYGLNEQVIFFNIDIEKENILNCTKQKVDAVFVDIPEPWKIIDKIYEILKDGHTVAFLNPTIEQILNTLILLDDQISIEKEL